MANDFNRSNDELENIREENEFKKMKMMLEHGAVFSSPQPDNKLPPIVENEFLKNIEKFEDAFHLAKRISVFDFIGKPTLIKADLIDDGEISSVLDNTMNLLNEMGISLDTICEVDDRTLYKFITEELMLHEIDDIKIPGMMCCFTYEDFHPNHEYDIGEHSIDFINSYLKKDDDFYIHFLTKEAEDNKHLQNFRNLFISFSFNYFEITQVDFDTEHAIVKFVIDFTGIIDGTCEKQQYSGEGIMELIYTYEYWCIDRVIFPKRL